MFNFDPRLLVVPALVATAPALAQDRTLKVGSPVPGLTVRWVQGDVDSLTESRKTYVVEFWATWCGPCMKSIPHLNELHQKYASKGLVIVGISDEPMGTVKPWVAKKGASMSYPIAVDDEKKTNEAWMKAAGQNGIPCAFVCRGGQVQWIGNPLDPKFDSVVLASLSGRYDPELTRKAEPTLRAANDAVRMKNYADAYKHFDAVMEMGRTHFGDIAVRKYRTMLVDAKDPAAAREWGLTVVKGYTAGQDVVTLAELATFISSSDLVTDRDFDLAQQAADAAAKVQPSPDLIALRAEVMYRAGKPADAAEVQYDAWMAADPSAKADYKRVYDTYKKAATGKASTTKAKS
jgi:thiol-disulfide isomerase/thioredoxin